jgi:hypothetical protein
LLHLLLAVNDKPSFTPGNATISVEADSTAYSQPWATNISAGPGENQTTQLSIECGQNGGSIFSEGPSISNDGVLSFTPRQLQAGTTRCTVTLTDSEGSKVKAPLAIAVADGEFCG